jgi:DNA-binding NarL/FixJ family response regulator
MITAIMVDAAGSTVPVVPAGGGVAVPGVAVPGVEIVARTAVAAEAVRMVVELQPQLVIVDLEPVSSAVSTIDAVVVAAPQVPVLALAATPDHAIVLAAVRAGASSVVVAAGPDELATAAARTARGEAVFSPGLAEVVLSESGRPADPQLAARQLTEREADVLRLVVEGLTARQAATRLGLSPRTVENHVQSALRKLRLRSRAALVRYAIENGLA